MRGGPLGAGESDGLAVSPLARDAGGRAQSFRARARDGECRLGNAVTGACEQPARRALLVGVCCRYRMAHAACDVSWSLREAPSRSRCCACRHEVEVRCLPALMALDTLAARYTPNDLRFSRHRVAPDTMSREAR